AADLRADRDRRIALLHAERQLREVHESIDARLYLDEETEVGAANDLAVELRAGGITIRHVSPRIGLLILHRERNALAVVLDLDDLDCHGLSDRHDFLRVG